MQKSDFYFDLPEALIAQYPPEHRRDSRLLVFQHQQITHRQFTDFTDFIEKGDLLVFNNTKVIPARLFGKKCTGGRIEVLIERTIDQCSVLAHLRSSKTPKLGTKLFFQGGVELDIVKRVGDLFELKSSAKKSIIDLFEQYGHTPLPPYIRRNEQALDKARYQTIYAEHKGAVAAPTAGLHFDQAMLDALQNKGVEFAFVTLHVGAGTFQPVRTDNIKEHKMHSEYIDVSAEVCAKVKAAKANNKRIIAIGTTSVRCLETATKEGNIKPYQGDTDIFIYPGYQFQSVDVLLTNFHLPESTLLMLVSAFSGHENIMNIYQQAVEQRYRFFSYGDVMLLFKSQIGS